MYYMCKVSMKLHLEVWNMRWQTKLLLFIAQLETRYPVQHAECSIILCKSPPWKFPRGRFGKPQAFPLPCRHNGTELKISRNWAFYSAL
ncbi:hypothetical protein EYC80_006158 [Monilinia laxa]|uniref:Uncharacterized protein n=1 Tax=Monilinia laxa TaxID=61186 RepID=A0A5N6KGB4_MONLA|nr:hypothetical protein EYC80_006158 [Monilinia laxa]